MSSVRFDYLFPNMEHSIDVITQEPCRSFVFTDCNGGIQQAILINRIAQLIFDETFEGVDDCLTDGKLDPQKFGEKYPDETLPEEMEGFHFFDKEHLERWLEQDPKRSCPLCGRKVKQIISCPYLTEKFHDQRVEAVKHPPQPIDLKGEHIACVEPSSVLQDADSMQRLFLLELACMCNRVEAHMDVDFHVESALIAYFLKPEQTRERDHLSRIHRSTEEIEDCFKAIEGVAAQYSFESGLIGWCLERDNNEARALLVRMHQEKELMRVNLDALKENPIAGVLKQSMDAYLESLGPPLEERLAPGAQMQHFLQCFFGNNTNGVLFNSLMTESNLQITYKLTDVVMLPPERRRFLPNFDVERVKMETKKRQTNRAIIGLFGSGFFLFYAIRYIRSFFRSSSPATTTN